MLRHGSGDWNCPQCGFSNFGRNRECKQCKCYKSKALSCQQAAAAAMAVTVTTTTCASASASAAAASSGGSAPGSSSGGSSSAAAAASAKSTTVVTFSMPAAVQPAAQQPKAIKQKEGDWFCACGAMNFRSRAACYKCAGARVQALPAPPIHPAIAPPVVQPAEPVVESAPPPYVANRENALPANAQT